MFAGHLDLISGLATNRWHLWLAQHGVKDGWWVNKQSIYLFKQQKASSLESKHSKIDFTKGCMFWSSAISYHGGFRLSKRLKLENCAKHPTADRHETKGCGAPTRRGIHPWTPDLSCPSPMFGSPNIAGKSFWRWQFPPLPSEFTGVDFVWFCYTSMWF